ncbi:MAG TPA: M67 family metallopeptidase [Terriglobales bacterium]|nr:M67 family metallopeptidase [Terriglobales bacterium]
MMSSTDKLRIAPELVETIRQHGVATYPHECCGALLGRDSSSEAEPSLPREIMDLFPLVNRRDDSPHNRFSVTPRDVIDADRAAEERGLEVVGWYHSHPDHPARPSEYDREHAWPWYSYIIVSVRQRVSDEMTSWRLKEDRSGYTQEVLEIQEKAPTHH